MVMGKPPRVPPTTEPGATARTGLLVLHLDGAGGASRLSAEEGRRWQPGQGGYLWALADPESSEARAWLETLPALRPQMAQSLLRMVSQTRVETPDNQQVMLALDLPRPGRDDLDALRFWLTPDRAISLFSGSLTVADDCLRRLEAGRGPRDVPALLAELTQSAVAGNELAVLALDEHLADLEYDGQEVPGMVVEGLRLVQRTAGQHRRGLARQREALAELHQRGPPWLLAAQETRWRDLSARLAELVHALDGILDRTRGLYDYQQSRMSAVLNDRLYLLTLISAIMLPLNFITSLLGVNVGGIPGRTRSWAFAFLCAMLVLIGLVQYVMARRWRWLPEREHDRMHARLLHRHARAPDSARKQPGD